MMHLNRFLSFTLSFSLLATAIVFSADRGIIRNTADLNHSGGKLGAFQALIIGIDDYKDPAIPDLQTAVNDAHAIAQLLQTRYGFKTEMLINRQATASAIYNALMRLVDSAVAQDSILIYFAGHGDINRRLKSGWWIPADAISGKPLTYLDNTLVQQAMKSTSARHVLVISDSCYAGTLFGTTRALPPVIDQKYYLNLYNEKSRWGMTSGNRTPVADEGDAPDDYVYPLSLTALP